MIKIGMLIADRYEILEKIGTGGMSDVYKAKDHKLNRNVAVKVLKQEFSENANFVSKFRVEAQAAAGLMHPNIVNVYDVGEEKGLYYIVMELVEGITLKKYIEKKARLSVKEAVSIAIQVSMGLEAAHRNHVIHRDIKPQNIIISKDGKVKVTDFGIAKAATSNTITSNVMGSVHYTSPEQARGGYSDEKSDIYSLGITLFEMLTGRVPFNGETTVAIAIKHIQQAMPSPCDFVPEIPRSVEQIVLKCCEKSPDRRYQNMSELIADLKDSLLHPDEDFVQRVDPETESATRLATEEERESIRDYTGDVYDEPEEDDYQEYIPEPPARRRGGRRNQERSAEPPMRLKKDVYSDRYDDLEDDYDTDHGRGGSGSAEKIVAALAVIAALVIGGVILFYAARTLGLIGEGSGESPVEQPAVSYATMRNVIGRDAEEAKDTLSKLGLNPVVEYEESQTLAAGLVISSSASEGEQLPVGSEVVLKVSASVSGIEIPDVVGKPKAEARVALEQRNFQVSIAEASDETVEEGLVISQSPEAGTKQPSGSSVVIIVSAGKEHDGQALVPTVTGMTLENAKKLLEESGLTTGEVTEEYNDDANLTGLVFFQSVQASVYVAEGTAISLKVSKGKEPEPEPVHYSYTADITAPVPGDEGYANYVPGTIVYVVIIASDGTQLLAQQTDVFPIPVSFTNLSAETGTLKMSYISMTEPSVVTDPATGQAVAVPGGTEQATITRRLTFTPMN